MKNEERGEEKSSRNVWWREKSCAQKAKQKKEEGKGRENARFEADGNYFEKFDPSFIPHPSPAHPSHFAATSNHTTYIHTSKSYRIVVYPIWYYYL